MFGTLKLATMVGFILLVAIWSTRVRHADGLDRAPTLDAVIQAFKVSAVKKLGCSVRGGWDAYLTDWAHGVAIEIVSRFDDNCQLRVTKLVVRKCKNTEGFIPLK